MMAHTRSGTIAFTALTHTRASALPIVSIAFAARSTMSRIDSISTRAVRDDLEVLAEAGERLAEGLAVEPAPHQQVERTLGGTDRAHAVVDAAGAEAHLADLEPAPLAQEHVRPRHAHVVEAQVHVPVGRVVLAEHVHATEDLDPGRVHRHEDLRLAASAAVRRGSSPPSRS